MRRILKRLPSPAMVVAIVALIAAMSGTALAGGFITGKKFKKQSLRGPLTYVSTTSVVGPPVGPAFNATQLAATCPGGFYPTGGSARTTSLSGPSNFFLFQDYPSTNGWVAQVYVFGPPSELVVTTAICAKSKRTEGTLTPPTI